MDCSFINKNTTADELNELYPLTKCNKTELAQLIDRAEEVENSHLFEHIINNFGEQLYNYKDSRGVSMIIKAIMCCSNWKKSGEQEPDDCYRIVNKLILSKSPLICQRYPSPLLCAAVNGLKFSKVCALLIKNGDKFNQLDEDTTKNDVGDCNIYIGYIKKTIIAAEEIIKDTILTEELSKLVLFAATNNDSCFSLVKDVTKQIILSLLALNAEISQPR